MIKFLNPYADPALANINADWIKYVGGKRPVPGYLLKGTKAFEQVEGRIVIDRESGSAFGRRRAGIKREQANRYYKRRTAIQDAWLYRYAQRRTTAAEHVNRRLKEGFTKIEKARGGHVWLVNPDSGQKQLYRRGVEIDYIKTVFGVGGFERNY